MASSPLLHLLPILLLIATADAETAASLDPTTTHTTPRILSTTAADTDADAADAIHPTILHPTPRILATAAGPAASGPASSTPAAPAKPTSPSPSASTPPTKPDLISIMTRKGCKSFASLLSSTPDVLSTFQSDIDGGLSVFCPVDRAVAAFMPSYKNLTADAKSSLLLYHGVPVYYSIQQLRASNGVMNTLATDGGAGSNFNFTVLNAGEVVTIKTGVATASVLSTVHDDGGSLAVFAISEVLRPQDLFKPAEVPAPAPAPEKAPAGGKKKKKGVALAPAADSPDATPADQKAADEKSGDGRTAAVGGYWAAVAVAVSVVASVVGGF